MSDYPVGATWEFTNEKNEKARVWLDSRDRNFELWKYETTAYTSGPHSGWSTSKRAAIETCPIFSDTMKIRYKRIK